MKCSRLVVVAAAAIFSGGPLSIALADNMPAQHRKVVPVPYRHHHHHYVETPKYHETCFLFFCEREQVAHHHHAWAHHHHVALPKYRHHHHVQAPKYHHHHHHYVEAPRFFLQYFGGPKSPSHYVQVRHHHHYVQAHRQDYDHDED